MKNLLKIGSLRVIIKIFILSIIVYCLLPTSKIQASVIYSQNYIGENYNLDVTQAGGYYFPTPFIVTATSTKIRVKINSGICSNIGYGSAGLGLVSSSTTYYTADGSFTADGDYCIANLVTSIPTNETINEIFAPTYATHPVILDGSFSNSGYSKDGYNILTKQGGFAFQLCDSGTCSNSFSSGNTTRIDSFTYSTTTQKFNIQGYFNATSTNEYDSLSITSYNNIYGVQSLYQLSAYATSTRNFNFDIPFIIYTTNNTGTSTAPINNDTQVIADISNINNLTYTITTLASSTLNFTSSTTGSVSLTNIDQVLNYQEQECSIINIIGCIKNAFVWALWPTKGSFTQFYVFQDILKTKAPTAYFYVVRDNLLGLNTTSTPTFGIVIPVWLKNTFFTPIDISIASLLWFYYAIFLYKRIKHIQL